LRAVIGAFKTAVLKATFDLITLAMVSFLSSPDTKMQPMVEFLSEEQLQEDSDFNLCEDSAAQENDNAM
jgi:hypothetical protein